MASRRAAAFAQRAGASRRHRLTGRGAFEAVFESGARHEGRYVQLVVAPARGPVGRIGFVVGRKCLRRAVDRNRMKRMLRPTLAAARPGIEAYDIIVRLKRPCNRTDFPLVRAEAVRLLAALAPEPAA